MDISKFAKDYEKIMETKKNLEMVYEAGFITKDQLDKALVDLIKPYK
jgi:hypothetical protein